MRYRTLALGALALAILISATVVLATADDRTLGQKVDDALLGAKVRAALLQDLGVAALAVEVSARDGVVTLGGTVESRTVAEQSESVAAAVEGVGDVRHSVRVEPKPTDTPVGDAITHAERELADAVLETRVKRKLLSEVGSAAFDIEVEATDGTVSLSGKVDSREHEQLALRTARECEGVVKVIDLIES